MQKPSRDTVADSELSEIKEVVKGPSFQNHFFSCFGSGVMDTNPFGWLSLDPLLFQFSGFYVVKDGNINCKSRLYLPFSSADF